MLPMLTVRGNAKAVQNNLTITSVKWTGLRCRIEVIDAPEGSLIDIRTCAADPATSVVAAAKALDAQGHTSLVVPDDARAGDAAQLVVVSAIGQVLARQGTILGG